jgi:hypothetical protein
MKIASISVTEEQHALMRQHPEINWSAVCRDAIEAKRPSLQRDWLFLPPYTKKKYRNRMPKEQQPARVYDVEGWEEF